MTTLPTSSTVPETCSVVVIGAGISGLTAARDLVRSGITDVIVVEARDRVGGRLDKVTRENGKVLMRGGEFVNPNAAPLLELAADLGVETELIPPYTSEGGFVRVVDGVRIVEPYPLSTDPEAMAGFQAANEAFEALLADVDAIEPWTSARAAELDSQTLGSWLDENISNPVSREAFYGEFVAFGFPYEVSLLYALWHVKGFGGLEQLANSHRFVGGTLQLTEKIAEELGDRVVLNAPVRLVEQDADGVTVHTWAGTVRADSVIIAMEPSQSNKIEFIPKLPAARDRLQDRWLAGHGVKINAVYDRPFWRDENLAGVAVGQEFITLALDVSPTDASEGILCAFFFASNPSIDQYSDVLDDPGLLKKRTLEDLALFYGPEALNPTEFHLFDWSGDRWSDGCGGQVPPGMLSTVGRTLRAPIGRILWAGAETGDMDFLGGAVSSGKRAAREAATFSVVA